MDGIVESSQPPTTATQTTFLVWRLFAQRNCVEKPEFLFLFPAKVVGQKLGRNHELIRLLEQEKTKESERRVLPLTGQRGAQPNKTNI
jgi:hypothetical protein